MFADRRPVIALLLLVLVLLVACGGPPSPEPSDEISALTPTPESTDVSVVPQIFVLPRETEKRLVNTEVIPQPNCDGTIETSDTVERSHSLLRTLELGAGLTVSAEGRAGVPGIGEVAVGAAVASYYQVSYGTTDTITRSVTVGAKEGTNVQYTLQHYEIWEKGELLIVAGPVSQQIPYSFRKDFSIEKLPPANIGCPGQVVPTSEVALPTVAPTPAGASPVVEPTATVAPTSAAASPLAATDTVGIPVRNPLGEAWTAPATGTYLFTIESGAYNPWELDSDCATCWRTRINAYVGCEIKRELSAGSSEMAEPKDPTFTLGNFSNMESFQAAESFAKGMAPVSFALNKDDCVRFVTIDGVSIVTGFNAHDDNRGLPADDPMMIVRITGP